MPTLRTEDLACLRRLNGKMGPYKEAPTVELGWIAVLVILWPT